MGGREFPRGKFSMGNFSVGAILRGGIFRRRYSPCGNFSREKFFIRGFSVEETFHSEDGISMKNFLLKEFSGMI